ncbi:MAG: hypothetical protein NZ517_04135 [Candidatus Nitrosocaldus sp.]|nr:hypothetical protein [Candidatus Nitrosocaldus sp.]
MEEAMERQLPIYLGYAIYIVTSLLISLPIIYGVWRIVYSEGFPAGGDPADHVIYTLHILKTGEFLIPYSHFPFIGSSEILGIGYYPSLFHAIIAVLTVITTFGSTSFISVVSTMQAFMLIQYTIGISGYALLIKKVIDSTITRGIPQDHVPARTITYYSLLILASGLFIYSTSPIIKTFRDGGYGEIFSMWCILPFYLYFLIQKRWYIAPTLLAVIASTHNLSFVMAMAATVSFFLLLLVRRDFTALRKTKDFAVIFLILFIPALILFYAPTIIVALNAGTGKAPSIPQDYVIETITPNLYYAGIISGIVILLMGYRQLGWLYGWSILYFPIFHSPVFAERFARELSIPFGLMVGIAASLIIYKLLTSRSYNITSLSADNPPRPYKRINEFMSKKQSIVIISLVAILLFISYTYFSDRFELYSNPLILNYYSKATIELNTYLANLNVSAVDGTNADNGNNRPTIVLFGVNSWLDPIVYPKMYVLEVLPPQDEQTLSVVDRNINRRLNAILEDPNSKEALDTIKRYNIRYVVISDILPGRWYPDSYINWDPVLDSFEMDLLVPYARLEKITVEDGTRFRVYFIDHSKIPN